MRRGRLRGPTGPTGPWVLGFESGGDHLSVALWRLAADPAAPPRTWRLVGQQIHHRGHRHADAALTLADQLLGMANLAPGDLALVASGRGPGGFTGVRVGLATAVGLGAAVGCPVWPVDSLRALAMNAGGAGVVLPLIDARRNEAYGAVYRDGERLSEPRVGPASVLVRDAEAIAGAAPLAVFGSGATAYDVASAGVPATWHIPRAAHTALLAARSWNAAGRPETGPVVDPAYIRPSDAELNPPKP